MTDHHNDAIWLFGSLSRGDNDAVSDIDVLFISDSQSNNFPWCQLPQFSKAPTISQYTWKEVERMAEYGSLFLKHLSLEAQPIYEAKGAQGRLNSLLGALGVYQHASRDLQGFITVHSDVEKSLNDELASVIFEIATLATIFRHACILGCDLLGSPCFSRVKPIQNLVTAWNLPEIWVDEFPSFYSYRLYSDGRQHDIRDIDIDYVWNWHKRTGFLLSEMQRRINE